MVKRLASPSTSTFAMSSGQKDRPFNTDRINMITFMQAVVGEPVVAECVDDTEVSGVLESVDHRMKFEPFFLILSNFFPF